MPERPRETITDIEDHSLEGAALLLAAPRRLIFMTNLVLAGVLAAAIAWSLIATADIVVTASGVVAPEQQIRRVYAPVEGELVDVYVSAGMPVRSGDVVARLNARDAINAASKLAEANMRLTEAKLELDNFPEKRALLQRKAESLRARLEFLDTQYHDLMADGMARLAAAQRAKLTEARNTVDQAVRAEQNAKNEAEQFERLFNLDGGGGVSRAQLDRKRNAYEDARARTANAQARLSALEYELSSAVSQADKQVADTSKEIADTRIQLESTLQQIEREQAEAEVRYRSATLAVDAARRLSFENFDENNFLKVIAPVSGVVTEVPLSQQGDKIQSTRPLLSIAPAGSRKVLRVRIAERDRGFLTVGQAVKMKFNAFPYARYGSVAGRLDYVSPTIVSAGNAEAERPVYEGRVSISREYIGTESGDLPIRFGMGAVAEIVVRERRVIDFVLDPLRRISR